MSAIEKKSWSDFRATGLLWFVNRLLHLWGWAIVMQQEEDGTISDCYAARVRYRGFTSTSEVDGFEKVARYMRDNSPALYSEAEYPSKEAEKP